ncbi:MAG: hypothetical protein M1816_007326 [Peltula sp. TS41687]|nr:MAG: hypothetical protein M1816_007326 [Peltula sp. TS41687]
MPAIEEDNISYPLHANHRSSPRRHPEGFDRKESHHSAFDTYGFDASPVDPHDFYRGFHDPFISENVKPSDRSLDTMKIPPLRKSGAINLPENTSNKTVHTTWDRKAQGSTPKTPSVKSSSSTPSGPARPAVTGSSSPKPMQGSLKNLVDRFNQKSDETLPLPLPYRRPGVVPTRSRSPATKSSKMSGTSGVKNIVGDHPVKHNVERPTVSKDRQRSQPKLTTSGNLLNGKTQTNGTDLSIDASKRARLERSKVSETNNPWASQSTTALHHSQNQSMRRPLFGEVIDIDMDQAGFGIEQRPRRGSEGSSRPLVAHRRARSHIIESPSSPTAWYLGADHLVAKSKTGDIDSPVLRPPHRRAKSDFARNRVILEDVPPLDFQDSIKTLGLNESNRTPEPTNRVQSPKPQSRIPKPVAAISGIKTGKSPTAIDVQNRFSIRALRSPGQSPIPGTANPRSPLLLSSRRYDARDGVRNVTSPVLRSSRTLMSGSTGSNSTLRVKDVEGHGWVEYGQAVTSSRRGGSATISEPRSIPQLGPVDVASERGEIPMTQPKRQIEEDSMVRRVQEADASHNVALPIIVDTVSVKREPAMHEESEPLQPLEDAEGQTQHSLVGPADTDSADGESIQILLESSPITQVELDRSGNDHWDSPGQGTKIGRPSEPNDLAHLPAQEIQPLGQHGETGSSHFDAGSVSVQEHQREFGDVHGGTTWSPSTTLSTPHTGNSTQDSSTYGAINRVLEQYHQIDITSPTALREFRERLLAETPELAAHIGGWDPKHIPQLLLQGQACDSSDSPVQTPDWSISESRPEEERQIPSQGHVEPANSVTDIESNGFEEALGEHRISRQPSEGDWTCIQPSLEVDEETRLMHRASLRSKSDWEDASPSVADWMQPQVEETVDGPTPPPKEPVTPVEFPNLEEDALFVNGSLQEPTARPTAKGLGLAIDAAEPQNVPIVPPPPPPTHAPPPPPIFDANDEEYAPGFPRPRSPPSPSIYSRNPPSSIFPSAPNRDIRVPRLSFMASELSTPHQPVFTPSGPQTRSTSSSQSRDANNSEHPFGQTGDMTGIPPVPGPEQARLSKRRNVIKELLDTESNYFRDVKLTVEIYKPSAKAIYLPDEDIKILFGNLDQVVAFTETFFDSLRQAGSNVYVVPRNPYNRRTSASTAASSATEDRLSVNGTTDLTDDDRDRRTFIGEVFGQYLARMEKVYCEYVKNHDLANKKLEEVQHRPATKLWLQQCHAAAQDMTTAWSLDSLLVKPVQRLLKYPLLLTEILKYTPENHPDYTALEFALREIKAVSLRINDTKKRAELVEKVLKRKRKESDSRSGLSKALGRRTEKLKQHVGLSDSAEDAEYKDMKESLISHIGQLTVAQEDFEIYLAATEGFVERFQMLIQSIESYIDVSQGGHLEVESKWRKFRIVARELSAVALAEHKNAVEASVIEPLRTLLFMYQRPKLMVEQREQLKVGYARLKTNKGRGDKTDKRTQEEIETFLGLNETLKEEVPKLFAWTRKLACECLIKFVELQMIWQATWQVKIRSILDEHQITECLPEIVNRWSSDFAIIEAQTLSLGICNGSFLAETANFLSPPSTRFGDELSFKRPSVSSTRSRGISMTSNSPPQVYSPSDPAFMAAYGSSGHLVSPTSDSPLPRSRHHIHSGNQPLRVSRIRTGSNLSNSGYMDEGMMATPSTNARAFSAATTASMNHPNGPESHRPSTSTTRSAEIPIPSPALPPRPGGNLDTPAQTRPGSTSAYSTDTNQQAFTPSSSRPFSGFFSSAMPMSENNTPRTISPRTSRPTSPFSGRDRPHVLWLAVSIAEFNVDRARSEAGYPFLTYVKSELFDVVAEKGELWLAQNQDDKTHQIGWIWRKHFTKLS